MIEIFTGKTVEEAKDQAAAAFGAAVKDIHFEILEEPKKGLFGRLKGEARVKAEYEPLMTQTPVKAPKPAAPITPAAQVAPAPQAAPTAPAPTAPAAQPAPEKPAADIAPVKEAAPTAAPEAKAAPVKEAPATEEPAHHPAAVLPATLEELSDEHKAKLQLAIDYISSILRQMGLSDAHTVSMIDGGVLICFDGDGSGTLIGRRGDTLDALQYLASMIANKGDKEYFRITLDSCGYREKRRKTLEELAVKISKSVIRTGRSTTLEPMNPYERRIIHSAVSAIDGVTSRSVGEEPFRKVVIASTNPRAAVRRDGDRPERSDRRPAPRRDNRDNRGNDRRRDNRPPRNNGEGPRKLDLQTSFEKDYKRPRPEDDINAGLYGKIEF